VEYKYNNNNALAYLSLLDIILQDSLASDDGKMPETNQTKEIIQKITESTSTKPTPKQEPDNELVNKNICFQ
jgi:hypothetical protein